MTRGGTLKGSTNCYSATLETKVFFCINSTT